ncbi:hypothetical protein Leryth_006052 [Lithospermum erythrorhizon]|nr:hypothetical protein Leryth_006052 [Lithospermum erythrorhizon]
MVTRLVFLAKLSLLLTTTIFHHHFTTANPIGVNYGTVADNLPPPSQVASFLKQKTTIDKIKLFDANPDILRAFANSGISVTICVANADIPGVSKLDVAKAWVANHVLPFYPSTKINRILVGNEVYFWGDKNHIAHLVPAMRSIHTALKLAGIDTQIQVSTPHAMTIIKGTPAPSTGRFRRVYDRTIFKPMLQFHRETKSPFMICPYPFFALAPNNINYALFKPNRGVFDPFTKKNYTNMFDAEIDAVYSAMKALGYGDVDIVIGETGWPSMGDPNQFGVSWENAVWYNKQLIKHVTSGIGTPLMPKKTFETYIFALFNENLKPSVSERNFGLFRPDFSPVYDVGLFRKGQVVGPTPTKPSPKPKGGGNKQWCVPKQGATNKALQANIDYICSLPGFDCKPIQNNGPCFQPDNVRSHAAYVMNAYYQSNGRHVGSCYFSGTGVVVKSDPSYGTCKYVA